MSNCTDPYTDLELLSDGHFKFSNNIVSVFTLEDVKYLKHIIDNGDYSISKLCNESKFSYPVIARIINTLENGDGFNKFLNNDEIINDVDDLSNSIINIYDGIHIENHYHYSDKTDKNPVKTKPKGNINAWSKRVRARDNYTCIVCDKYDKLHMEAHHIEPKSINPSRATDDSNGVCICQSCHRKYNNRYEPKNQNGMTFAKFIADEKRGY